ncbi:O-antigen ligase family protein [Actinomadura sp. DC4]|uniref:O-antigen ligase family protein n=1 Tax=Actinomadura sp. DC4 TaxID=3055069 RepID=UPI0025B07AB2|nr:O-antigen ligase family protein [Actinomadura sp. DC4]MDN3358959.1 O-antigen ligase family protein [Actinomadura sp. DC4]
MTAAVRRQVTAYAAYAAARTPLLTPPAALLVTFVMLSRPQLSALAVGAMVLGLLAVSGPGNGSLFLVPVGLLGAVQTGGPVPALGGVAAVAVAAAVALSGRSTVTPVGVTAPRAYGGPHRWIAVLAALLLVSFFFPAERSASSSIYDITGMLAGLVLLSAVTAFPPSPGGIARVTAVAGSLTGAYVLAVGDHADGRLDGLGLNPNYLGAMLVLPLVAAVGLTRRTHRAGWLVPAAVCGAGIVATQSRGAFLASVAGIAVVLLQGRSLASKAVVLAVMAAAGAVLPGIFGTAEHFVSGPRPSAQLSSNTSAREHAARFAADVAIAHPLRGIGYGMFPAHAAKSPVLGLYIATHDDYLRLAAESGVLTLVVFLALLWLGVRGRPPGDLAVLRAVVVGYAVGLFFANQLANLVVSMPFWLSLGCLLASPPGHHPTASDRREESRKHDRQPDRDQGGRTLRVRPELV